MSQLIYGVQFRCDHCSKVANIPDRFPAGEPIGYHNLPVPDGWTDLAHQQIHMTGTDGRLFIHLCGDCAGLTIAQLASGAGQ